MTYNPKVFNQRVSFVTEEAGSTLGAPLVSSTLLNPDSILAKNSWHDIGPTGSGATTIWTALDSLSLDTDWIMMRLKHAGVTGTASTTAYIRFYLRKGGGTNVAASATLVHEAQNYLNSGNEYEEDVIITPVGLNASNVFELYYDNSFTLDTIELWLVGYGKNG